MGRLDQQGGQLDLGLIGVDAAVLGPGARRVLHHGIGHGSINSWWSLSVSSQALLQLLGGRQLVRGHIRAHHVVGPGSLVVPAAGVGRELALGGDDRDCRHRGDNTGERPP